MYVKGEIGMIKWLLSETLTAYRLNSKTKDFLTI